MTLIHERIAEWVKTGVPLPYAELTALGYEGRRWRDDYHISSITRFEVGYSARSAKDLEDTFSTPPFSMMPVQGITPAIEDFAWQTLRQLAKKGQHRAPSIPDLLIAATAYITGMIVLHNDKDFDLIAKVTEQKIEKLKL